MGCWAYSASICSAKRETLRCIAPTASTRSTSRPRVDEAELGITDIVRGADLLESSARQIYVMSMLHWPAPRYVHLPVAIDAAARSYPSERCASGGYAARPVATLCAVLRFLNQTVPAQLEHASLEQFWAHAIERWDLHRVGRTSQRVARRR